MHTISIFVDQNRMPKLASYFECQTHLAKKTGCHRYYSNGVQRASGHDAVHRTTGFHLCLDFSSSETIPVFFEISLG